MRLKISGGILKGRPLATEPTHDFRPTTDQHRQMVFNILGQNLPGYRFLDVYAGSGAMGLEALSRGAAYAVFVENFGPAVRQLNENARRFGVERLCRVIEADASHPEALPLNAESFDIIFIDPPYDVFPIAGLAGYAALLDAGGLLVCEHSAHNELIQAPGLTFGERRKSGDSAFSFFRK